MDKDFTSKNLKGLSPLQELHGKKRIVRVAKFWHNKKIRDSEMIQKMAHFSQNVRLGILPDGEVLESIAVAFEKYLSGEAENIDSAFKANKKTLNAITYNAEKNYISDYLRVLDFMAYQMAVENKDISYTRAIEEIFAIDGAYISNPKSYKRKIERALPDRDAILDAMVRKYKLEHKKAAPFDC